MTDILGNHMTARELWVKWWPTLACLLSKLQPDQRYYGRVMESQARVPPILFIINSATEWSMLLNYVIFYRHLIGLDLAFEPH